MQTKRYLTKSRFTLANECATKLFYVMKPEVYANQRLDDPFLQALADGGFQVGELARQLHPGGEEILSLDSQEAIEQTNYLLAQGDCVLYEPAFRFENLFLRADIVIKRSNVLELVEVKAKSCDGGGIEQFLTQRGSPLAQWKPYLADVAFQKYVIEKSFPSVTVTAHLMLADKSVVCPVDGLHQKFRLDRGGGRTRVVASDKLTAADRASEILRKINVDSIVTELIGNGLHGPAGDRTFSDWVKFLADHYQRDERIKPEIGKKCSTCEFRTSAGDEAKGLRSGFRECWKTYLGWQDTDFLEPTILEIGHNFRGKDALLDAGKYKFSDLERADLGYDGIQQDEISGRERQWLQVHKWQTQDPTKELRRTSLKRELDSWFFPLHFIDFETMSPAIPFNRGQHPYAQLAFQFSHHVVYSDGKIEHKNEYLESRVGVFPNYEFLRALKNALVKDNGTIFRYSAYENSVLAAIRTQLIDDPAQIPDRKELVDFIESIASPRNKERKAWLIPERNMVDMLELVKKYYYDPAMGGSASLKKVFPAVLRGSEYLRNKYARPIYGVVGSIPSHNFKDKIWIEPDHEGNPKDPYSLLPKLFADVDAADLDNMFSELDGEIREGGAAMTAYARMQFTEMSDGERAALREALLKYCELDTLAMVFLYEAWREWLAE